jgi:uncharacterized protein (TIGR00269 family)
MTCKLCRERKAEVKILSLGAWVCKQCFCEFFENRVKKLIEKYRMFGKGNRVGVFLSGGKDSAVLFAVLKRCFPEVEIVPVHLNLGIAYFSEKSEKVVRELCKVFDTEPYVYSTKAEEGFSIDEFVFTNFKDRICGVCGTIKRNLFSKIAREFNFDVIATGHHLDDVLSTMLGLFFQGDFEGVARLLPVLNPLIPGQAKKVKPLYTSPEKEILLYAEVKKLPFLKDTCPHKDYIPLVRFKNWLDEWEKENKQIKYQLLSVFRKKFIPLVRKEEKNSGEAKECKVCGGITTSESGICGKCKRVELLKRIEDKRLEITPEEISEILKGKEGVFLKVNGESEEREIENPELKELPEEKVSSEVLEYSYSKFRKYFKKYRKKIIIVFSKNPELGYRLVLKFRKSGFRVYNLKAGKS